MVKDHSDSETVNPLSPHRLLFLNALTTELHLAPGFRGNMLPFVINFFFFCTFQLTAAYIAFNIPVVGQWLG